MGMIRPGTCAEPGPYEAHCTKRPGHDYSCYDAGEDVSFNSRWMQETDTKHACDDPACESKETP